ncbi:hypothetical protein [Eudoraea chungangensis]|uniref:hypothetical protein n=1 Tax=Eudoraea chungangensis TaxID=1481905 RepID=UPI0023EBF65B|nr:hypothetical protein [Eudoraea chungangensis]
MATTKLIEHLENIKVFTDYKKSGLSSITEFWELVHDGSSIMDLENKNINYASNDNHDPTEKELEELQNKRDWLSANDQTELYLRTVRGLIISRLDVDEANIPALLELDDLKQIISENHYLKSYMATTDNIIDEYIRFSKNVNPEDYFNEYQLHESHSRLSSLKNKSFLDKYGRIPENEHSDVFGIKGYRFFVLLINHFPKSDSDFAYIFWKLKSDKFINSSIGESDFSRFLDSQGFVKGRLKPIHTISTNTRDPLYSLLHKLLYL